MILLNWKKVFFLNRILFEDMFFAVIEVSFYVQYLELTFLQYTSIISSLLIFSALIEIPSGIISDRIGRKKALIIGNMLVIISLSFLLVLGKKGYIFVFIIQFIKCCGAALASGNFNVLIYENAINGSSDEELFKILSTKFFSIGALIASFSGIISGITYGISPLLPMIFDIIIKCIKVLSFTQLKDKKNIQLQRDTIKIQMSQFSFSNFSRTNLSKNAKIYGTILLFSLIFTISRGSYTLYLPIAESLGIKLKNYGFIIFILNILVFIMSKYITVFLKNKNDIKIVLYLSIISLSIQFTMVFNFINKNASIIFMILLLNFAMMQIIRIFSEGLSAYYINRVISDKENKTTYFSLYQTLLIFFTSLLFWIEGLIQSKVSNYILTYLSIIVLFIFIFSLFLYKQLRVGEK